MVGKVFSAGVSGIDGYLIEVEADIIPGMVQFSIVGLPDTAVKESKNRVESAIKNSSLFFPNNRITINLAPADMKKDNVGLDLPIAIGILIASGQLLNLEVEDYVFIGELSLDGSIRRVNGILPIAIETKRLNKKLIIPIENAKEASVVLGLDIYPVKNLNQVLNFFKDKNSVPKYETNIDEMVQKINNYQIDYKDIKGQYLAKRALEIAAAGGHNALMIGPPGSGKTMLAKRLITILPEISFDEALETTKIHSVAGKLPKDIGLLGERPFRNPHHTISDVALIGGGKFARPGEVSLAHNGVLFLDELTEFKRSVLEVLRQPLEDGSVTISRAVVSTTYPSRFMLVASMNPCPCGYYGDPNHNCTCSPTSIKKYQSKISGPLLDRIDLHIDVPALKKEDLIQLPKGEKSEDIRKRVNNARKIQNERFKDLKNIHCNAHMGAQEINKFCKMSDDAKKLLNMALDKLNMSARSYDRILKISRTIADMDNSEIINEKHISEAIQYRSLDRYNV